MEANNNEHSNNAPEKGSYEKSAQFGTSNDDSRSYTGQSDKDHSAESSNANDGKRLSEPRKEFDTETENNGRSITSSSDDRHENRFASRDHESNNDDRNSGMDRQNQADWSE